VPGSARINAKLSATTAGRIDRDLLKPGVRQITGGSENRLIRQIIRRETGKTIK